MRYFPIYLDLNGHRVVVAGAGAMAAAKVLLLLKTDAVIEVFGQVCDRRISEWVAEGRIRLHGRAVETRDLVEARLLYAANDDIEEDARVAALGRAVGCLVNVVDNLDDSQFITPAIVDRDPVTVAIGSEGTAPVLARHIKTWNEARLPRDVGVLARIAGSFRKRVDVLAKGSMRRAFWQTYYEDVGPRALAEGGAEGVHAALRDALEEARRAAVAKGRVTIAGAGPGDPDLLTMKVRRELEHCDVVVHDRLVAPEILELARREATFIDVGKVPYSASWAQDDINALLVEHAAKGAHVVRLKSGDPTVYGRLDEEMDVLDEAGIPFEVVPGITAASAGAAAIKASLTKRGRNSSFQFMTGRDVDGFAEHDWSALARPGEAAAIYMGVRATGFVQGRLMMHGASPETPVTAIENISRRDQRTVAATIGTMGQAFREAGLTGPAVLFIGLAPRAATEHFGEISCMEAVS